MTLAIALLLGFSERLLDGVLDKLVETGGGSKATATNPQPPQKTTSGNSAGDATNGSAINPHALPDGIVD